MLECHYGIVNYDLRSIVCRVADGEGGFELAPFIFN